MDLPLSPLLTDLYQLNMAYGYFKLGMHDRPAVFHHFFRRPPFAGGFTMTAGLESLIDFLKSYRFTETDLSYLKSLALFDDKFLNYLKNLKITLDIDAMPEGSIVFPSEPIVRVTGPLLQAQLLETTLLNLLNFPTLIATKAARVTLAAKGDKTVEFGLRRAQGIDGAMTASRAAFVGGINATSNVLAGKAYGIPVQGTQAHSWVLAFEEELESFMALKEVCQDKLTLLVDTFDTREGVRNAIQVGKQLKKEGRELFAIRLDSGDLAALSIWARNELDAAGMQSTQILASNELDEWIISDLKSQGAKIDAWGVGTRLVTGGNQGALEGVYKLSAIQNEKGKWDYRFKLSEQLHKISNPGFLQVRRYYKDKKPIADLIYDEWTTLEEQPILCDLVDPTKTKKLSKTLTSVDLLQPIFRAGECVYTSPPLQEIQKTGKNNLAEFPSEIKRFINPDLYLVGFEKNYHEHRLSLIRDIRSKRMEMA